MTATTDHAHELCDETHIGRGQMTPPHRWTEPHCVECGEPMPRQLDEAGRAEWLASSRAMADAKAPRLGR